MKVCKTCFGIGWMFREPDRACPACTAEGETARGGSGYIRDNGKPASIAEVRAAGLYLTPSNRIKPRLFMDGNRWCALQGDDPSVGVAGFGDTPEEALAAFDLEWMRRRTPFKLTPISHN
jgi:hypothetical protein